MDAPERGALKLVWFLAAALVLVSLVEIGLYLTVCWVPQPPQPVAILPLVWKSIPAWLGVIILIKAKALAEWISERLDL